LVIEDIKAGDQLEEFIETLGDTDNRICNPTEDFLMDYVNENASVWASDSDG